MKRTEAHAEVSGMLKICPVCGALNSTARRSCCNCSWHGVFEFNQVSVAASLNEINPQAALAIEAGLPEPQHWRERLWERMRQLGSALKRGLSSNGLTRL